MEAPAQTVKFKKTDLGTKHYSLYVLKLVQNKYYVGITTMADPYKRIAQHETGYFSAQWTKKFKPLETLEIISLGNITREEAERIENAKTLEYMKQFGYQNVRGGSLSYSGKYVKVGDRYYREEDWKMILAVSFMAFALLVAAIKLF
jgi:predicted GIY-YIG superfamily endonuclease